MTKKPPLSLSPSLRFPEFQDAPEWPRKSMDHYLKESRIKGSTGEEAKKLTVKLWGKGVVEKQQSIQGSVNTQYYRRRAGQFIYSKLDFLNQAFGVIPGHLDGFESTVDLPCFDIDPELNAKFLLEYVQREQFYKVRGEIADGGRKAKRIQVETFLDCPIYAPSKLEQQKIADCLGSLDELIAAETRKLEALRRHKQGLMQQLFPRAGETVPRLRFPEFEDGPKWRLQSLDQAATFLNGRAYSKDELLDRGKYRVLRVGNFFTNEHWYYSDLELDEDKYCDNGDLLYAWSASFGPRIWRGERVIYHYHIWKVVERKGIDREFLYACLDCETQRMRDASARGLGMQHLTKAGIESWECGIPTDADEQRRIAKCLAAADAGLEAQVTLLDALQRHKRGLLQQLFPSPEERG
jgi:type I restriction enzyme S subunit